MECQDGCCFDDAEKKITYDVDDDGHEEYYCAEHAGERKAKLKEMGAKNIKVEDYDVDEDEDEDDELE